jgi:hypothetical protein
VLPLPQAEIVDEDVDLNGLWRGRYGPHGEEVVSIEQKGEAILARKVTGDPNVPKGEITFRARLDGWSGPGEGQIAERGFKNPRFVPGLFSLLGRDRVAFEWLGMGRVVFHRLS